MKHADFLRGQVLTAHQLRIRIVVGKRYDKIGACPGSLDLAVRPFLHFEESAITDVKLLSAVWQIEGSKFLNESILLFFTDADQLLVLLR